MLFAIVNGAAEELKIIPLQPEVPLFVMEDNVLFDTLIAPPATPPAVVISIPLITVPT